MLVSFVWEKEINKQLGGRINGDLQGSRKSLSKKIWKVKKESKEKLQWMINWDSTFITNEMDVRRVCMEHFEYIHNIDSNEELTVNMFRFDSVKRNSILEIGVISR